MIFANGGSIQSEVAIKSKSSISDGSKKVIEISKNDELRQLLVAENCTTIFWVLFFSKLNNKKHFF